MGYSIHMAIQGWSDELLTGFSDIDAQHRELFARVANLHDAAQRGDLSAARATLLFLEHHVLTHFSDEERRMRAAGYPRLTEHVAEHEAFVRDFLRRKAEYEVDPSLVLLVANLSQWLDAWLHNHVCTTDADMARYLRATREPRSAEESAQEHAASRSPT